MKKNKTDKVVSWLLLSMSTVFCIAAITALSNEEWKLTVSSLACLCMSAFFVLLPYHLDNTRRIRELEKDTRTGKRD